MGQEVGKGQIRKILEQIRTIPQKKEQEISEKQGKSEEIRKAPPPPKKDDKSGRTSPSREAPPFETDPV